jgi:hypothetical protein
VCFAIGDIERLSSRRIIYTFPEPVIAGVLGALSSPISFAGLASPQSISLSSRACKWSAASRRGPTSAGCSR